MVTAPHLDFAVLGPLEVRASGRQVNIPGDRQRLILAALLLNATHPVRVSDLVTAAWDEDPPGTARRQVQNAVSQLRQALIRHGAADPIHSEPGGYRLNIAAQRLDSWRFEALVADGRRLAAERQTGPAAATLRAAISLWRGPALAGLTGTVIERGADRLNEARIAALEDCVEAELEQGGGPELVAELSGLVADDPLRERLAAAYMLALYRGGRQADALAVYRRVTRALAEELGVDPSPMLRERFEAVLRRDPALTRPPPALLTAQPAHPAPPAQPAIRPTQLPAVPGPFIGRAEHLHQLDALLAAARQPDSLAVVISAIAGTAGVGKTTLALYWAHRVAAQFPDGQLYVDLRGYHPDGSATSPAEAVRGFLDAFGVPPKRVPLTLDAQTSLLRSLLAGKRVLMVLDNARDAAQVRPLLPGTPGCLVLVTSRDQLGSLVATAGAHPLRLALMSPAEARQLLIRRLGAARVDAEPHAVAEIVGRCAGLPLALAIAATRAATHPGFPLATLAQELRAARGGLDALDCGDPEADVRAVFSWSYQLLNPAAARTFRLLALHPGLDLGAPAAASLTGLPRSQVRSLLTELTRAHLLTEHTPGRYALHDLLRAYAAELAVAVDPEVDRRAARHRWFDHYLHTAHRAALLLYPHRNPVTPGSPRPGVGPENLADAAAALGWFTSEHPILLAAVHEAAGAGFDTHAWQLASTLATYLYRRGHWHARAATQQTALRAAQRLGDRAAQAHSHHGIARGYAILRRDDDALTHFRCALDLFQQLADHAGQANTHLSIGHVLDQQNRVDEALRHTERALALYRIDGRPAGQANALNAMGLCQARLGDHHSALRYCEQALALHERIGDRQGTADAWDSVGYAHHHLGQYDRAIDCYRRALEVFQELGHRPGEGTTWMNLGDTCYATGDLDGAGAAWRKALAVLDELDNPLAARVRADLDGLPAYAPISLTRYPRT